MLFGGAALKGGTLYELVKPCRCKQTVVRPLLFLASRLSHFWNGNPGDYEMGEYWQKFWHGFGNTSIIVFKQGCCFLFEFGAGKGRFKSEGGLGGAPNN